MVFAKAPDPAEALGDDVTEQLLHQLFLRPIAGRKHDQIGRKNLAALHPDAFGRERLDIGKLFERDLALDEEVGAADVEIITATAGEVLELPAGIVLAEIELEADLA